MPVVPSHVPIVVTVTPQAAPSITVNDIVVSGINQPIVAYHHTQGVASAVWTITHNLGWQPNVTVQDSGGSVVEGEISYTSTTALTITFSGAFSGNAYLS
jgi:hypothetical protein